MAGKLLWTLKEVAEATGFSLRTLERECAVNRIDHVRGPRGRGRFMTRAQIDRPIERCTVRGQLTPADAEQEALERVRARVARRLARRAGAA